MRCIKDLCGNEKLNKIIKKVKYVHFPKKLDEILKLYLKDTKDGDIYFLDAVIALEPLLKIEICNGNISEREMDYFFEIYGSVTYREDDD